MTKIKISTLVSYEDSHSSPKCLFAAVISFGIDLSFEKKEVKFGLFAVPFDLVCTTNRAKISHCDGCPQFFSVLGGIRYEASLLLCIPV